MAKGIKQKNTTHYQQENLRVSSLINYDFYRTYALWLTAPSNKSQQWTHPCITYSPTTITSIPSFLLTAGLLSPLPQHPYTRSALSSLNCIFYQLCLTCWWAKRCQDLCRNQDYMNTIWLARTPHIGCSVSQVSNTFPQQSPQECFRCPVMNSATLLFWKEKTGHGESQTTVDPCVLSPYISQTFCRNFVYWRLNPLLKLDEIGLWIETITVRKRTDIPTHNVTTYIISLL